MTVTKIEIRVEGTHGGLKSVLKDPESLAEVYVYVGERVLGGDIVNSLTVYIDEVKAATLHVGPNLESSYLLEKYFRD